MRHSCISFLCISLFLLTACSGEKVSHDQVSTVNIDKGVEHFDVDYTSAQYQSLFKNPKTIRLETNDKCLLSANAYLLNVTPKYIVIGDKTSFYFFNAENGSFLSVMDRKGNGPEEYVDIFSRFFDEEKELIYVATPNKTKLYKPDGTFVSEYPKDSISNFIGVSNGYWGTYKREYQKSHLVAFFDKDWNMKQSFFPFDAESVTGFSGGYIVPRFKDGNNQVCIVINDTLYASRKEKLIPVIAINQGKLKMPTDLNGDLERMLTEGKYCIKAENALLVNDLLFYDFFWNESRHYTLWDTNSGELLTHSEKGYAMPYNEKAIVNTPVSLIRNNKAYTLLSIDKLAQYGLASEEDDSNPTLLCVDLEN